METKSLLLIGIAGLGIFMIGIGLYLYLKGGNQKDDFLTKLVAVYYSPAVADILVYVYKQDIHDLPPVYVVYHHNLSYGQRFKKGFGFSIADALKQTREILAGELEFLSRLGHLGLRTEGVTERGTYSVTKVYLCKKADANITLDAVMSLHKKQPLKLSKGVQTLIALHIEYENQSN